jgi:hypothetical protein
MEVTLRSGLWQGACDGKSWSAKLLRMFIRVFLNLWNRCALMQVGEIKRSGQCPQHQVNDCECGEVEHRGGIGLHTSSGEALRRAIWAQYNAFDSSHGNAQDANSGTGGSDRLAGLRKPHYEPYRARILDRSSGIETFPAQGAGLQAKTSKRTSTRSRCTWRLQFCPQTSHARDNASGGRCIGRKAVELRTGRGNDSRLHA